MVRCAENILIKLTLIQTCVNASRAAVSYKIKIEIFLRIPLKFLAIDTNTPGESEVLWKDVTNLTGNNKQKDYHIVKIICKCFPRN